MLLGRLRSTHDGPVDMRVWLTQSQDALVGLEPALAGLGHEVLRWPLIGTVALEAAAVRTAAEPLLRCRWLLYTSPASVRAWHASGLPPVGIQRIGAVGPGTAAALEAAGARPDLIGGGDAVSLAAAFLAHPHAAGPVGLPVGDRAFAHLRDALEAGGYQVVTAIVYRTETLAAPEASRVRAAPDAVLFASPSAVTALSGTLSDDLTRSLAAATFIAIGPTTAAALRATGRPCLQASAPTIEAVLACLRQLSADELGARERVR